MEKPEWFKEVDASNSAPETDTQLFAATKTARFKKGFAALGVAAVIAAGGFAVNQVVSGSAFADEAPFSASAPASSTGDPVSAPISATSGGIAATPASAPSNLTAPAIGGGKPSITGAGADDEDDDD